MNSIEDKIYLILYITALTALLASCMYLQFTKELDSNYISATFLLFLVSLIYCYKRRRILRNSVELLSCFKYLWSYIIVYSILLWPFRSDMAISDYILIVIVFLSYYYFKICAVKIGINFITVLFCISTLFLVLKYSTFYTTIYLLNPIRNNATYTIIMLLPILLCVKNRTIAIVMSLILLATVAISAKRAGTAAVILGILTYLFIWIKNTPKKNYLVIILMLFLISISFVWIFEFFLGTDSILLDRLNSNEDSGGRDSIIMNTLEMYFDSNIFALIFGHGYNSVVTHSNDSLSAHNDFVESLFDIGIIGFILYVSLWIQLIKLLVISYKEKYKYTPAYAVSIILFLILSNVSHVLIYPYMGIPIYAFWGWYTEEYSRSKKVYQNMIDN